MAKDSKVAARYSRAIADFLKEPKLIEKHLEEFRKLDRYFLEYPKFTQLLSVPIWSIEKRREMLDEVIKSLHLSEFSRKIVLVIFEMGRLNVFKEILEKLLDLHLKRDGKILLHVQSSQDLTPEQKQKLEQRFEKVLGKEVFANFITHPDLLGGLKVTANGKVYDGTVSGWLNQMESFVGG